VTAIAFGALLLSILSPISAQQATAAPTLITCVNLQTGTERISRTGKCRITQEAQANWHKNQTDSPIASGVNAKAIVICSNKENSPVSYQVIRKKCARHQVSNLFSRSGSLPTKPVITEAVSYGHDSASLKLAADPASTPDAPIAFYTITINRVDSSTAAKIEPKRIYSWKDLGIAVTGLQGRTTYTFTVTATTVDGTSAVSIASIPVTTPAYVPPASTSSSNSSTVAAPAFTLSSIAETKTVNSSISGYTIDASAGGAIASYSISPAAPAGISFNTSTGLLSGTPTATQSATTYTITATNASGSTSRTYTLTVTPAVVYTVGQTGPGGGIIFYVATTPFACGPTRASSCTYLEAAPALWNGGSSDPNPTWAQSSESRTAVNNASSPETATATAIGWGYRNTRAIILQGNTNTATSAAALADSYTSTGTGGTYDDWYLASKDELNQMCKWARGQAWVSDATICNDSGTINSATFGASAAALLEADYHSSSERLAEGHWAQSFFDGSQNGNSKRDDNYVRPVRAF
jgi:hypothetical protein